MLTESRKRRRSCASEDTQTLPQAKRSGGGHPVFPELGRDVWDSESSSSDSSGVSSPELGAGAGVVPGVDSRGSLSAPGPSSPAGSAHFAEESPTGLGSYHHINRILREAHFSSLQTRGQPGTT